MRFKNQKFLFVAVALGIATTGFSKVYRGTVKPGNFDEQIHISECKGNTFLSFMVDSIYPTFAREGQIPGPLKIEGVKAGHGVELRLTENVTTYHIGFIGGKKRNGVYVGGEERSGRSYSAVGKPRSNGVVPYIADASYAHYLDSLEELYDDEASLENFYSAILRVVANCDASGFEKLDTKWQQVAADFVAVYIAEQFRHLISGKGVKLGRSHNWDDALFQVTLLAGFHAGQGDHTAMFYEGEFSDEVWHQNFSKRKSRTSAAEWRTIEEVLETVYPQNENPTNFKYCLYKKKYKKRVRGSRNSRNRALLNNLMHDYRDETDKREMRFRDYWQFNWECKRSGVNVTRGDFSKAGSAISRWLRREDSAKDLAEVLKRSTRGNLIAKISGYFINNDRRFSSSKLSQSEVEELVNAVVAYLVDIREHAGDITNDLLH